MLAANHASAHSTLEHLATYLGTRPSDEDPTFRSDSQIELKSFEAEEGRSGNYSKTMAPFQHFLEDVSEGDEE